MANRTVLIVDDLADMRLVLRLTLQRMGCEIVEADNGVMAVEMATRHIPDVILMDYNMPLMDGVSACREIKSSAKTQHIPVLIYTGAYADAVEQDSYAAGASDFLVKPLLPADLRQKVESAFLARV